MRTVRILLIAASASALLAACGPKTPSGQVVATVDGKEVTVTELRNELNGFQAPTPQIRKQAEQQALNNIITRKVLAQAAEKQGIAKTPAFAQQLERTKENLVVQTWEAGLVKQVPPPSQSEVDKFVADNPDLYAQHKIFEVDQVRFPRINDPNVLKQLQPLNTLEEVTAVLNANKIPNKAGPAEVDALTVDPAVVPKLVALAPTTVFLVPSGNLIIANHIREIHVAPLTPEQASKHASAVLLQQRTRDAIQRRFGAVVAAAKKDVKYSKEYQPPAPPKAAAAAPPAAAKK
ncbi:MAG: hypothetical protein JWR59_210 [Brevundimonas sp.]|nr:hypothetical protein [Brevundimonas sp.]